MNKYYFDLLMNNTVRYWGSQAKIFVPVDFSLDLVTTISPYSEMLDLEIFGRALLEEHILSSAKFYNMALRNHDLAY